MKICLQVILVAVLTFPCFAEESCLKFQGAVSSENTCSDFTIVDISEKYQFEGNISEEVLTNYLSRAITQAQFCQLDSDGDFKENLRMLKNIGAKFIGRAGFVWTPVRPDEDHFEMINKNAKLALRADPEFILQCCIFEAIFKSQNQLTKYGVDLIPIPEFVFKEFDLPVQKRNFNYEAMLYENDKYHDHWVKGASIPDISKIEVQMYFYYRAARYIDAGFEAIHFGQIMTMDDNDPNYLTWFNLIDRIRAYAKENARRHFVLCDAHTHGVAENGKLLFDFHSYPQRPRERCGNPFEAELEIGFQDAIFRKSKGGMTPSGWECDSLPYLVELDNSGAANPGVCGGPEWWWPWGRDEISWFAHCSQEYRNYWLRYVCEWLSKNDPIGHLQMPGAITIHADPIADVGTYRINTKSDACLTGFSQEETVKKIWLDGDRNSKNIHDKGK